MFSHTRILLHCGILRQLVYCGILRCANTETKKNRNLVLEIENQTELKLKNPNRPNPTFINNSLFIFCVVIFKCEVAVKYTTKSLMEFNFFKICLFYPMYDTECPADFLINKRPFTLWRFDCSSHSSDHVFTVFIRACKSN